MTLLENIAGPAIDRLSWPDLATLCAALSVVGLVVGGLLQPDFRALQRLLLQAALVVFAALSRNPLVTLIAFCVSLVPEWRRQIRNRRDGWDLAPTIVAGVLLLVGTSLLEWGGNSSARDAGAMLVLVGAGGLLGWFPLIRVASADQDAPLLIDVLGRTLPPVMLAALLFWRLFTSHPKVASQGFLIAAAGIYSALFISLRLFTERQLTRKLALICLTLLSLTAIVLPLANWETTHQESYWGATSNLFGSRQIIVAAFAAEVAGILTAMAGCVMLGVAGGAHNQEIALSGAWQRRPLGAVLYAAGLCSLMGLPPFPGFWWRFHLTGSLLLPFRRSTISNLAGVEFPFVILALAFIASWCLTAGSHSSSLKRLMFDEPLRTAATPNDWRPRLGAGLCVLLFLVLCIGPMSWGPLETFAPTQAPAKAAPTPSESFEQSRGAINRK